MVQRNRGTLHFPSTGVLISPYLQVVTQADTSFVKVIQQDSRLTLVTIPPLALALDEEWWILCPHAMAFTYARCPVVPNPPNTVTVLSLFQHVKHTSSFDQSRKLQESNLALENCFLRSHLEKIRVVLSLLSLGREQVNRANIVSILLAIPLTSPPWLSNLVVTMMVCQVPLGRLKVNLPLIANEGVKMRSAILVKLSSYHVLRNRTCSLQEL